MTKALTIDEYIEEATRAMTPGELERLAGSAERLWNKVAAADPVRHARLQVQARVLEILLGAYQPDFASLPAREQRVVRELGVAAHYILKGYDVIPDEVEEIGFDDDAFLVDAVFNRNRAVIEGWVTARLHASLSDSLFAPL